ncbi:MAG: UpxY family transcription antiterminator [Acidobacteriota bacterium]
MGAWNDSWFALQVRTRHEKSVAALLRGQGYECFLPLYKCRRRWSDRIKEIDQPLFPGYLFCWFNPRHRLPIVMTPGVVLIVGRGRTPIPVEEHEISAIQTIVESGLPSHPWPFLRIGERVRVEYGALRGLEGHLLDFKGRHRIVVSVALLQRSVAVDIDSAWVSPVGGQRRAPTPGVDTRAWPMPMPA